MTARYVAAIAIGLAWLAPAAFAQRPSLAGEATYGVPGGQLLVHYATAGIDAVPGGDADADGVPDFVAEVATTAELALDHFVALGFRRPLDDGALGGDHRIDIYLRDLNAADGHAATDHCDGDRCVGFIAAENDYAGFSYPSRTEGVRSVVPHELFHLVQDAYSNAQPSTWTEGTAVWSVEDLFGDGNSDFERFLPSFLTKSYRPFERPLGGFGDSYPYGAALWPYFLAHRFGVDAVVASWAACERQGFLDATDTALAPGGSTIDDAWIEFTRWNTFTGTHAAGGAYPDAARWPEAPREPSIAETGTIYLEGLSARYVPMTVARPSRVTVSPTGTSVVAAWLVADGAPITDGRELARDDGQLIADADAGSYTLVVTGLTRSSIATAAEVTIGQAPDDGGGCSSVRSSNPWLSLAIVVLLRRERRAS